MPHFPIEYDVELHKGASFPMELSAAHRPMIAAGPPPEFGGADSWWSPEHLLVSATAACLAATILAAAQRANLHIGTYKCRAKGILDRTPPPNGGVMFTSIHLALELNVLTDDADRARKLVDEAKNHCFVAKSLRCPVDVSVEIRTT